ncbi:MAG: MarC family protein [Xenococcaceae cyanobacterium]
MNIDADFYIRSIISMLVITTPFDPVKILFFNEAISNPPRSRTKAAVKVASNVFIILGGAAIVGRPFLNLLGINLNAFSAVGGLVIALMGFEMLYGGGASKAQGENVRQQGPEEDDTLLIPLTLPLIAGPGAISTIISIGVQGNSSEALIAALVSVGAVALVSYICFGWLSKIIEKAKPQTVALLARIGGLLLATIGTQMILSGLKGFFS